MGRWREWAKWLRHKMVRKSLWQGVDWGKLQSCALAKSGSSYWATASHVKLWIQCSQFCQPSKKSREPYFFFNLFCLMLAMKSNGNLCKPNLVFGAASLGLLWENLCLAQGCRRTQGFFSHSQEHSLLPYISSFQKGNFLRGVFVGMCGCDMQALKYFKLMK